jgi:hypothetical protein
MQYVQRLAERVSTLSAEELRAIMDDVTNIAPNQSVYNLMVNLYGQVVDEDLVSWVCTLLEKRGHNTILLSVLRNCKEGYNARGFYQRYSYMFGVSAREMLFVAANMPDLATWSYHAVVNLQLAATAVTVWQNGIKMLQTAYQRAPDDPFYGMATTNLESNARSPSQLVHREGSVINTGTPIPFNTSGSLLTPDSAGNGDGARPTVPRDPPIIPKTQARKTASGAPSGDDGDDDDDSMGQDVDSSAMVSTPGSLSRATRFRRRRNSMASRFSRPPLQLGDHAQGDRE